MHCFLKAFRFLERCRLSGIFQRCKNDSWRDVGFQESFRDVGMIHGEMWAYLCKIHLGLQVIIINYLQPFAVYLFQTCRGKKPQHNRFP